MIMNNSASSIYSNGNRTGARHPLTIIGDQIEDFFIAKGFDLIDGPEVEAEWFNFDALNINQDHPARSQDSTFFIANRDHVTETSGLVLRAHTSPMQIRTMLDQSPPLYKVGIGNVFRPDSLDATHSPVFKQLEGLAVDKGLKIENLKELLDAFASHIFNKKMKTRLRPYWFAYTDPGAEIDVQCVICHAQSSECSTCSGEGWIEWGGCGMVHPAVLINCGLDPNDYSAFAFGMGIERTLMLREGIQDLRHIRSADIDFALNFSFHKPSGNYQSSDSLARQVGQALSKTGHVETLTFPFINKNIWDELKFPLEDLRRNHLSLTNPIFGLGSALRTTLIPGLLNVLQQNTKHNSKGLSIFEYGRIFYPSSLNGSVPILPVGQRPTQDEIEALLKAIPYQPYHLAVAQQIQGTWTTIIDTALLITHLANIPLDTVPAYHWPWLPGHSVELRSGVTLLGYAGKLNQEILIASNFPREVSAMEIDMDVLNQIIRKEPS